MSLQTLPKVRKLQAALHAKAKESPSYRLYALYDKVTRCTGPTCCPKPTGDAEQRAERRASSKRDSCLSRLSDC